MTFSKQFIMGWVALLVSTGALAAPVNVAGIELADPIALSGATLQLNGAGIRYKAVFKVYVAALYLEKTAVTPEAVFAISGPKRISISLLREIDSNELGKGFTKAFEENASKTELSRLIPGLLKMSQIFSDQKKMMAGESFTIDWIPGTGTVISVKGKPQGDAIKEAEFFNAMLRIWLGLKPVDLKLRDALLGKPT